jgi:hypothetical protein
MPSGSRIVLRESAAADIPTPDSGQTALWMNSADGGSPYWTDDGGTDHSMQGEDGVLTYQDHGNTGATETVDASAADIHRLVANAATVTLTLSGAPSAGTPGIIRLWLEQDGSGGRDWIWPGSVDFGDAGEPDWTTRAGGAVDLVDLMTVDGGTTWVATIAGREGPAGDDGEGVPAGGDASQVLAKASGTDFDTEWVDPATAGPPDCYENFLTAPVTTVNADTWYAGPTITTPAAGTYLVIATLTMTSSFNGATGFITRIFDGASAYANGTDYVAAQNQVITVTRMARVTVTGSESIVASASCVRGSSVGSILDTSPITGATADKASSITAIRITSV